MLAFHSDPAVKAKYLDRVRAHAAADHLIKGIGWENGKGGAVGCTLEAYEWSRYPVELGISEILAALEDRMFEGLPAARAMVFPAEFLESIAPGANLSRVPWQFLRWLLAESQIGAFGHPAVAAVARQCADALAPLARGDVVDTAARSAVDAARSAAYAARSAAYTADAADAADAVLSAAESAAYVKMADKLLALLSAAARSSH